MPRTNFCMADIDVPEFVGRAIKRRGSSQKELAQDIGISQPCLQKKIQTNRLMLRDFHAVAKVLTDEEIVMIVRRGKFKEEK